MKKTAGLAAATVAICLLFSPSARAVTVSLQQGSNGYTGTRDTALYQDFPNNSAGGFPNIFGGVTKGAALRRSMISFDLQSAIPAGSTITSATLRLYCDQGRAGASPCELRRMTRAWNEGDNQLVNQDEIGQGRAAQAGDSTWANVSHPATPWTVAGGEFAATASGTGVVNAIPGWTVITGAGMANDLQAWLTQPSANYGWMLLVDEAGAWNAKRFVSSEANSNRPRLDIEYTPPASVGEWMIY